MAVQMPTDYPVAVRVGLTLTKCATFWDDDCLLCAYNIDAVEHVPTGASYAYRLPANKGKGGPMYTYRD